MTKGKQGALRMRYTLDTILSLIYAEPPYDRERSVFTCSPEVLMDLRLVHTADGQFLVEMATTTDLSPRLRLAGYPLNVSRDAGPLAFGPQRRESNG